MVHKCSNLVWCLELNGLGLTIYSLQLHLSGELCTSVNFLQLGSLKLNGLGLNIDLANCT